MFPKKALLESGEGGPCLPKAFFISPPSQPLCLPGLEAPLS